MAATRVVANSFEIALEVDALLKEELPELIKFAGDNTYAVAVALLYRGFLTLKEEHYPPDAWKYLFDQVMDLAKANPDLPPA